MMLQQACPSRGQLGSTTSAQQYLRCATVSPQ